jgi:hypothetical protein
MRVIDVQVHAYEHNHPGRPWAGVLHGPQAANGEEMTAAMDAVGVDAAIIVSTFNLYRYDPSYAMEVYTRWPDRFRVVKPIDVTDPAIDHLGLLQPAEPPPPAEPWADLPKLLALAAFPDEKRGARNPPPYVSASKSSILVLSTFASLA